MCCPELTYHQTVFVSSTASPRPLRIPLCCFQRASLQKHNARCAKFRTLSHTRIHIHIHNPVHIPTHIPVRMPAQIPCTYRHTCARVHLPVVAWFLKNCQAHSYISYRTPGSGSHYIFAFSRKYHKLFLLSWSLPRYQCSFVWKRLQIHPSRNLFAFP